MRSIVNFLFTFPYFIYIFSRLNNSCPTINTMLTSKPRYVKSGDSKIWLGNPPLPRRERSVFERTDYIADCRPRRVRSVFERTNNFAESRLVVRSTKDRTLGTGFPHGTHRTMPTPSLRDAPSGEGVTPFTPSLRDAPSGEGVTSFTPSLEGDGGTGGWDY